jgi:hypothetical protein
LKPKGNTSVQELLGENKFSTSPDRDYTDETYKRIVEALGGSDQIKNKVPFALSKEQKISVYQDLRDRIESGNTPDEIARDVLACMEEHLKEKEAEAYGVENPKLKGGKGGFKRVE